MSQPTHIRLATTEDATTLADLGARTFAAAFGADNTPDDLAAFLAATYAPTIQTRELHDPSLCYLIAESPTGQAQGFALLNRGSESPDGVPATHACELQRLYVDEAFHGTGVAQALSAACDDSARRFGADALWLGVWERNPRAIRFYEKFGYRRVGAKTFVVGTDAQTDLVMMKDLRTPATS
jgi:diamine N-acetyltransferase